MDIQDIENNLTDPAYRKSAEDLLFDCYADAHAMRGDTEDELREDIAATPNGQLARWLATTYGEESEADFLIREGMPC